MQDVNYVFLTHLLDITQEGASPTIDTIRPYLTGLRKVIKILARYKDAESVKQLQDQRNKLDAMLEAAQDDESKGEGVESK